MQKNIGTQDRIIRFVLAVLLFALAFWQRSWIFALIGLFVLYEVLASWCIFYQFIGKNTCPTPNDDTKYK